MRILALLLLFAAPLATAQPAHDRDEATEILAALDGFFDAMRAADTTALRSYLHPHATLYRVGPDASGETALQRTPFDALVDAVGSPHPEVYDERLGDAEVRVDDDLATVWVPYAFYLDDAFSHCGTNAVQLARIGGRWLTIHVTDTRRTDRCDPSIP